MAKRSAVKGSQSVHLQKSEARNWDSNPYEVSFYNTTSEMTTIDSGKVKDDIKASVQYYRRDSLVGRTIDFMVSLAGEGFYNSCEDERVKEWFDDWCEKVNIQRVMRWIFMEYFRSANAVIGRTLVPYKPEQKDARYKSRENARIPAQYRVFDPLLIDVVGTGSYSGERLLLKVGNNKELLKIIQGGSRNAQVSDLFDTNAFKPGSDSVPLNLQNVSRVLRMAQSYELVGTPLIGRALKDLYLKNKMKEMDLNTVNGVVNQIIKVTIGEKEHVATANKLAKLAQIFQNPTKTMTIVWDHTLKIEVIRPSDPQWLSLDKYGMVNQSIREAFGISSNLSGGGATGGGNQEYLSIKGFIANLIDARREVLYWLTEQYKFIGEQVGMKQIAYPAFSPLSFADEVREKQIIVQAMNLGLISYRSGQERLGFDPNVENARKTEEAPLVEEGKYKYPGTAINASAAAATSVQVGPGKLEKPNGRPQGKQGDYPPDRKPAGMKRLKEEADIQPEVLYEITGAELNDMGIKNVKQLQSLLLEKTTEAVKVQIDQA